MKAKSVVLLSGGLDSVYNLYRAQEMWPGQVSALFLQYGQKAMVQEKRAFQYFVDHLKVESQIIDISSLFTFDQSALTSDKSVPKKEIDIESQKASMESAAQVWVANRNGVFLNVAACLAESLGASFIVPGFNLEEAATFPDNSQEYLEKINASLKLSTRNGVQAQCFSISMNKKEIVADCRRLGVDLDRIWSCYEAGEKPCGECESCQRFMRARSEA